jgi:hypothetical protein
LGLDLINYHLMFVFTTVARLLSLVFLVRVKEKEAFPAMGTLQLMGDYALRRLALYKDLVLNVLRFHK